MSKDLEKPPTNLKLFAEFLLLSIAVMLFISTFKDITWSNNNNTYSPLCDEKGLKFHSINCESYSCVVNCIDENNIIVVLALGEEKGKK